MQCSLDLPRLPNREITSALPTYQTSKVLRNLICASGRAASTLGGQCDGVTPAAFVSPVCPKFVSAATIHIGVGQQRAFTSHSLWCSRCDRGVEPQRQHQYNPQRVRGAHEGLGSGHRK